MNSIKLFVMIFSLSFFAQSASTKRVEEILKEEIIFSGPNCHNTSLRALGLMQFKRYIHEPEMISFLESQCTFKEEPDPFSLGVIFLNESPAHSFVFINSDTAFTKNGVSKRALNILQDSKEMFRVHKKALEQRCSIYDIQPCDIVKKYFDCKKRGLSDDIFSLVKAFHSSTLKREDFFKSHNQDKILKLVQKVDLKGQDCLLKKEMLQSLALTINLANMGSLGPHERSQTEEFEKKFRKYSDRQHCEEF